MSGVNVENVRKWVEALRSGRYEQGPDGLRIVRADRTTYCCLGVACEIGPAVRIDPEVNSMYTRYDAEGATTGLPMSVITWLGVGAEDPIVDGLSLATWNDESGKSFAQIADLIEAEWLTDKATS